MPSTKRIYKIKTRKNYRRNHQKGGEHTTYELDRAERDERKSDTYAIDIRPSSSFKTPRSHKSSSNASFKTPRYSRKSSSTPLHPPPYYRMPKNRSDFPYEEINVGAIDIEDGYIRDDRKVPPKASPVYYTSSSSLGPKRRPMRPTSYELERADSEDRKIPFQRKKVPSGIVVTEYGQVQNQEYNPFSHGVGFVRKTRKQRNKYSKTAHKKHYKK